MAKKLREDNVTVKKMGPMDHQTWNDCPICGKAWVDRIATPEILHRTKLCEECSDREKNDSK